LVAPVLYYRARDESRWEWGDTTQCTMQKRNAGGGSSQETGAVRRREQS
jgi:hypothetical protein